MNFIDLWWQFALLIIGSYLYGSVNNAILITGLMGKDIRKVGSGNPGTMNVSR
ncbi:MAG: glycerol-3-phosphate acyltransferase, partial [Clostridia bacterium]|nr:glycerol-3-phosphate acyltransferase [Clostridia bacterium]